MRFSKDDVFEKVANAAFGKPLIVNIFRGHVVEAIVALAIEPDWRWCSEDWAAWDFENENGIRVEVKQSALKQSWAAGTGQAKPRSTFDIAPRAGRYDGSEYTADYGRNAEIYIFAFHGVTDETCDHRDPDQWQFYVVNSDILPEHQKTMSLSVIKTLANPVRATELHRQLLAGK